jgi:hypothetical protein
MLELEAKENKNALGISLQKHSGKTVSFVLEQMDNNPAISHISAMIYLHKDENWLKSLSSNIWTQKSAFLKAIEVFKATNDTQILKNIFWNTFDSEAHTSSKDEKTDDWDSKNFGDLREIAKVYRLLRDVLIPCSSPNRSTTSYVRETGVGKEDEKDLQALDAVLRFIKFFSEKGGDE